MQVHRTSFAPSASLLLLAAAYAICAISVLPALRGSGLEAMAQSAAATGRTAAANDSVRAAHVLSRLTFGARPGDLDRLLSIGLARWIEEQLKPEAINDSASQAAVASIPSIAGSARSVAVVRGAAAAQLFRVVPVDTVKSAAANKAGQTTKVAAAGSAASGTIAAQQKAEVMRARVAIEFRRAFVRFSPGNDPAAVTRVVRSETSERQLLELITDFWHNHFSVFSGKMPSPEALATFEREAIQPHALGKFRDLLGAVARSPAMLFYLDNHLSSADSTRLTLPEHREFAATGRRPVAKGRTGLNENYARELLELHTLGVDGGYTQQDVIEVARALTGWTLGTPVSRGTTSTGPFFFDESKHDAGEKRVLGRTLAAGRGIEDAEEVLDILASHPSTAHFIARKLAVRLLSDDPPTALVERAAAIFSSSDGDIREVVRAIITSQEFFAGDVIRSKIKSPYEFVLSMRRALGLSAESVPSVAPIVLQLNQPVWGKETPDGWPETGSEWMNSGAMFNRVSLAMRVANGEVPALSPDSSATWREIAGAPFQQQLDAVVKIVFAGQVTPETRAALHAVKPPDGVADDATDRRKLLGDLLVIAFSSPEFQRR